METSAKVGLMVQYLPAYSRILVGTQTAAVDRHLCVMLAEAGIPIWATAKREMFSTPPPTWST